ncbi:MAG TPA: glycosyltransferase family 4 protein [Candidatus Sumerlaeota bacterium]|nr:glycosyltransferase family 4 protein [Candidatus Sumerlaeota bacterium]
MPARPLRVLQVTSTSLMGGAEQMVMHLVRHADPARIQPDVLTLMGPGDLAVLAMQAGVESHNWALRRMADPRLLRRMQLFLRAGRYDLVHTYGLRADLATRWVANGMQLPLISSISSVDPWRRRPHVWLDRLTADGVSAWVAVAEAARQSRIRREGFPPERIHVVYNGIPDRPPPDDAARRRARALLQLEADAPVLGAIGNLRPAKGYPDLFAALARLRTNWPGLTCVVAGRDDSGGELPRQARDHGLEATIRWQGFMADCAPVLAAADVFVISSHWEGCPVNLLEAMRAGKAIVATAVGGIPEMIEHGRDGLLVPPGRSDLLAADIGRLLADPDLRAELGGAARRRFEERFTVERMVRELTEIYEAYAAG